MWGFPQRRGRRGGHADVYAYMVAFQTAVQFLNQRHTPPVTLALIAANVAVYLRLGPLDDLLPLPLQVCLNPATILRTWDLRRLVLSAFFHVDDTHLIYNMVSLLWKGMELERQQGSARFAATTGALLLLSHGSLVLLSKLLSDVLGIHEPLFQHCAMGFSCVLFGYKTLLNAHQPTHSHVGGMLLPTKYAAWGELLLIQVLVPESSFLGHLCGILAGLMLLHGPTTIGALLSGLGLSRLTRSSGFFSRRFWGSGRSGRGSAPSPGRTQRHGPAASRGGDGQRGRLPESRGAGRNDVWPCPVCTFHNDAGAMKCEMCASERGHERGADDGPSAPPIPDDQALHEDWGPAQPVRPVAPAGGTISAEDMRRFRLSRFEGR